MASDIILEFEPLDVERYGLDEFTQIKLMILKETYCFSKEPFQAMLTNLDLDVLSDLKHFCIAKRFYSEAGCIREREIQIRWVA